MLLEVLGGFGYVMFGLTGVEGTGDLSGGAVKCSLLAEQVHQKWCLERKEISASMRAASSFAWTPQPEVGVHQWEWIPWLYRYTHTNHVRYSGNAWLF